MGKSNLFLSSEQIKADNQLCNAILQKDVIGAKDAINKGASINVKIYVNTTNGVSSLLCIDYVAVFLEHNSGYKSSKDTLTAIHTDLVLKALELETNLKQALSTENLVDVKKALLAGAHPSKIYGSNGHSKSKSKHLKFKNLLEYAKSICTPGFYTKFIVECLCVALIYRDDAKIESLFNVVQFKAPIKFPDSSYDLVDMLHIMEFSKKSIEHISSLEVIAHFHTKLSLVHTKFSAKDYVANLLTKPVDKNTLEDFKFCLKHGGNLPKNITCEKELQKVVYQMINDTMLYRSIMFKDIESIKIALSYQARIDSTLFGEPLIVIASNYSPELLGLLQAALTVQALNSETITELENAFALGATTIFFYKDDKTILEIPEVRNKPPEIQEILSQQMLLESTSKGNLLWAQKAISGGAKVEYAYRCLNGLTIFNYLLQIQNSNIDLLQFLLNSHASFDRDLMENYLAIKMLESYGKNNEMFVYFCQLEFYYGLEAIGKIFVQIVKDAVSKSSVPALSKIISAPLEIPNLSEKMLGEIVDLYLGDVDYETQISKLLKLLLLYFDNQTMTKTLENPLKEILDANDTSKVAKFCSVHPAIFGLQIKGQTIFEYLLSQQKPLDVALSFVQQGLILTDTDKSALEDQKFCLKATNFGDGYAIDIIDQILLIAGPKLIGYVDLADDFIE